MCTVQDKDLTGHVTDRMIADNVDGPFTVLGLLSCRLFVICDVLIAVRLLYFGW